MTLPALKPYLDHLAAERGMSPRTVEAYGRDVTAFLGTAVDLGVLAEPLGPEQWPKLEGERGLVRAHLARLRRENRRLTSLDRHLAGIRSFFRYLQLTGRVETIPANLTAGRGGRERRLPRDLTVEMAGRLLDLPDTATPRGRRDRALLELLYGLGLRLAEVVGLDLGDLDLPSGRVRVLGKGAKERILPLGGLALDALADYLGERLDARGVARPAGRPRPRRGGQAARVRGPARPPHRPAHGPGAGGPLRRGTGGGRGRIPAHPAPQLRHAPAGGRGGHPRRPGAAGPPQPGDDADLHPPGAGPAARGVRRRASPGPRRRPQGRQERLSMERLRATTVLAVLRDGKGAIGSDGQVTLGNTVAKHGAVKVRRLFGGQVLAGFAGGAADAFSLFEKFEGHLERYRGHLQRATVELAREWRRDRYLRRLEAMMIVMDKTNVYTVSGNGDVIEADDCTAAIGSGGPYAQAAARALVRNTDLEAAAICRQGLEIAGEICIYTNTRITVLELGDREDGDAHQGD